MTVIKWRDSYNTGVARFDQEHQQLVELIDRLYTAVRDKSDKEVFGKACSDLVAYTATHFAHEEEAMAAVNYPKLEEHREKHLRLKQQALAFQEKIEHNFPDGTLQLYHFLRDWLVEHIIDCDKQYGPYLKEKAAG